MSAPDTHEPAVAEVTSTPELTLAESISQQLAANFAAESSDPVKAAMDSRVAPEEPVEVEAEKPAETEKPVKTATVDDFTGDAEDPIEETGADKDGDETDDNDAPPEDVKGEKATTRWGELRKKEKDYDRVARENEELKKQVAKVSADSASKEVEELRKAIAEKERIISTVSVTDSDEYYNAVTKPLIRLEEEARTLVSDKEDEDNIVSALAETNPKLRNEKLSEISEGLSHLQTLKLLRIADGIDEVFLKDQELRQNAHRAKEEIDRNKFVERNQETEKEKAARSAAADTVWKNIAAKFTFLVDEDGEVKPEYKDIHDKGRAGNIAEMPLAKQVFAGYAVELVPKLSAENEQKDSRIASLEATIKAMKGSSPSVGNGTTTTTVNSNRPLSAQIMEMMNG